ncbi:hypothetical protein SAMD00019534_079300 [Acytostelium subglobosum LB1]|uniref:hypothetical protein n=1 Tax=Acytostelium subglobosum LB1 TaxID=1410327 RepID=UPI0006451AF1|nr:hypothetical protein SAMD00019534_079300 [Acytostelium subglobosum LB1]GAM24755.1 hypothetical protein SAMD00019534_079300 [Acytostelium subglobosum LB1]|eukprot:XP_012752424.1 hypothetical protein SAMD00019534_079300 [Acytostelium subglobosum LB1]
MTKKKTVFDGCVITCCGKFDNPQPTIKASVVEHGGKTENMFNARCTHLITTKENFNRKTNNVKRAIKAGAHVVNIQFVNKSIEAGKRLDEEAYSFLRQDGGDDQEDDEDEDGEDEVEAKPAPPITKRRAAAAAKQVKKEEVKEEEEDEVEEEVKEVGSKRKRTTTTRVKKQVKEEEVEVEEDEQDQVKDEKECNDEEEEEIVQPKKKSKAKTVKEYPKFYPVADDETMVKMTKVVAGLKQQRVIFYPCAQECLRDMMSHLCKQMDDTYTTAKDLTASKRQSHCLDKVINPTLLKVLRMEKPDKDNADDTLVDAASLKAALPAWSAEDIKDITQICNGFLANMFTRFKEHSDRHKRGWVSGTAIRHIISESLTLSEMFPHLDTYRKPTGPRDKARPKKVYYGAENDQAA